MWELLLEVCGPLLLELSAGMFKPKGDVNKINAEAKAHSAAGRYSEAEILYRKALSLLRQALEIFPRVPCASNRAWKAAQQIAVKILESRGQRREAEALRAASIGDISSASQADEERPDLP